MKHALRLIFLSLLFWGCKKELTIDDITADNYRDLLKPASNYSLAAYDTGIRQVSHPLPASSDALKIISFDDPWDFYISKSDNGIPYSATISHNYTRELHILSFNGNNITGGFFNGLPITTYKENVEYLIKKGYTYKETELKRGYDILIKKFDKDYFVIVQLHEYTIPKVSGGIVFDGFIPK